MKRSLGRLVFVASWSLLISVAQPSQKSWSDSPGVSPVEVTFGAAYPKTGASSPGMSSFYLGVQTYFSFVNENGGIHGRKLSLLERDSKGSPSQAITATYQLVTVDQVFALLNNAPGCAEQKAVTGAILLGKNQIPNIFLECVLAEQPIESENGDPMRGIENLKVASYNRLSFNSEYQIFMNFIEKNFPDKRVALINAANHFSSELSFLLKNSQVICNREFPSGIPIPLTCNSEKSPLRNGDIVIFAGSAAELLLYINSYSKNLSLKYFANTEALNLEVIKVIGINPANLSEIYTVTPFATTTDSVNTSIKTFTDISLKYAPKISINQQYLNGMNSAYIVASVLGAVGKDLTRERFLEALAKHGNSFDALGLANRSSDVKSVLLPLGGYVVKFHKGEHSIASEVIAVNSGQISEVPRKSLNISTTGMPAMTQLLPVSVPKPKPSPSSSSDTATTTDSTPTVKPTPKLESETALNGEEEEPFAKLTIKREKSRYTLTITGNIADEQILVRATRKNQKSILFRVKTNDDGFARFTTTRPLSGYQVSLSLDGEILSSTKAP